jgi:hypothetical protein
MVALTCHTGTLLLARPRVPAVYLAHAFLAIVAILEVRVLNNLRACNGRRGSTPTPGTIFLKQNTGLILYSALTLFAVRSFLVF